MHRFLTTLLKFLFCIVQGIWRSSKKILQKEYHYLVWLYDCRKDRKQNDIMLQNFLIFHFCMTVAIVPKFPRKLHSVAKGETEDPNKDNYYYIIDCYGPYFTFLKCYSVSHFHRTQDIVRLKFWMSDCFRPSRTLSPIDFGNVRTLSH